MEGNWRRSDRPRHQRPSARTIAATWLEIATGLHSLLSEPIVWPGTTPADATRDCTEVGAEITQLSVIATPHLRLPLLQYGSVAQALRWNLSSGNTMGVFAALDVSWEETSICLVRRDGVRMVEAKVPTCSDAADLLGGRADAHERVARIQARWQSASGNHRKSSTCRSPGCARATPVFC